MVPQLPVPTDNIYKFYALFGLALFVTSAVILVTANDLFDQRILEYFASIWEYQADGAVTDFEEGQIKNFELLIDIARSDRDVAMVASSVIGAVGFTAMLVGFARWHRIIQSQNDRLAELEMKHRELQIEQLELQVRQLKQSLGAEVNRD